MEVLDRIKIAVKALISLGVAKNQEDIGKLLGYSSKSSFSQVLNGKVPLPNDFIDRLCKIDQRLVKMWIINEYGSVLRSKENSKQVYIDAKIKKNVLEVTDNNTYLKNKTAGIPLIPIEAMAGYGGGEMQIMEFESERFVVPTFSGADFLIQVKGSSMYPKYNSGDIVACKKLSRNDIFFQWNKVYVIDTEQGALIKRIGEGKDEDHINIISDNEKYAPFNLPKNKINAISIVMGVIRLE